MPADGEAHAAPWEHQDAADLVGLLSGPDVPSTFERWRCTLGPRSERATHPDEWAGALVLVEGGDLEVDCSRAGRETFSAGDVLVLGWLPLRTLRNPGDVPVLLVAVRRQGDRPAAGLLRVIRHIRS